MIIAQPYLNLMGGAERVILKIAQHYDAKIYTLEYNKKSTFEEFNDIDIEIIGKKLPFTEHLPYRASQGLNYGLNFYNLKIKEDYDLINAHISPSEWVRHKNKRVLWYCHTPPREVYDLYAVRMKNRSYKEKVLYAALASSYRFIASKIVKDIEGIIANSENTKQRIMKNFSRSATVINPGVEYRDFENKGAEKFFIYPSRIIPNKRQDYAIDAFAKFMRKTGRHDYKLVIAGALSNDKEHIQYFNKLKQKNVAGVVFKVNVSERELHSLMSKCTAVLFTAINEDFGYVPVEAMASSKPIISVDEGGPRETILNGKTGYLVGSADEMAEKMKFIVEHPDLAEEMGAAGRNRVIEKYSWESFFRKFDRIAEKIAKGGTI